MKDKIGWKVVFYEEYDSSGELIQISPRLLKLAIPAESKRVHEKWEKEKWEKEKWEKEKWEKEKWDFKAIKSRAEYVTTLAAYHMNGTLAKDSTEIDGYRSLKCRNTRYHIGCVTRSINGFDESPGACSRGIHYFVTRRELQKMLDAFPITTLFCDPKIMKRIWDYNKKMGLSYV